MRDLMQLTLTGLFLAAAMAMVLTTPGQMMIIQFLENIRL
jgi:hypothetical protein